MSNKQKLCKVKIFELQTMSIDERFAVKNSVISCLANDIQLEQSDNDNPAADSCIRLDRSELAGAKTPRACSSDQENLSDDVDSKDP